MIDKIKESRAMAPLNNSNRGALAVYGRIADPIAAVKELGAFYHQSGMLGVKTPGAGAVLALHCMCEGITPFEFKRKYHIIGGNLTMRSDAMLAEFRTAGGKFKWLNIGEDGEAVIQLEFEGNVIDSKYTMAMAERAKLIKKDGGWEKNPANMLRARAISEGVRMIAPEIIAGTYTPEEAEEFTSQGDTNVVNVDYVIEPEPATTKVSNSDNGEESPVSTDSTEVPFEANQPEICSVEQLQEIVKCGGLLGQDRQQVAAALVDAYGVTKPQELTSEKARDAIEKMQAMYEKKSTASQTA